jgi:uridylate kinase
VPTKVPPIHRPVVLSLGGSVILTGKDDATYLARLSTRLRSVGKEIPLVVTTGGGRTARDYIALGRALGLTEVELDELGIDVTRLHARLLAARVGPPAPAHPPTTIAGAVHEVQRSSPVILGGTEPGHTTDAVASLIAVRLRAERVVNATRVDGVYTRDPRKDSTARRFDRLGWKEFREMVQAGTKGEAGQEFVFDQLGADSLARAGIPLYVVDGRNLDNLEAALYGRRCVGTVIS